MLRHSIPLLLAPLATLGAAAPSEPTPACPEGGSDVVVKALRFSDGPPAYSFMVTNHGTRAIPILLIGRNDDTFIEVSYETLPTSVGSPDGWRGTHVLGHDPRFPEAHSTSLVSYLWLAESAEARIQPGESLSGFSVQFPAPKKPSVDGQPYPDLTVTSFRVRPYGARCPVTGTVEPDRGTDVSKALPPGSPRTHEDVNE